MFRGLKRKLTVICLHCSIPDSGRLGNNSLNQMAANLWSMTGNNSMKKNHPVIQRFQFFSNIHTRIKAKQSIAYSWYLCTKYYHLPICVFLDVAYSKGQVPGQATFRLSFDQNWHPGIISMLKGWDSWATYPCTFKLHFCMQPIINFPCIQVFEFYITTNFIIIQLKYNFKF